MFKYTVHSILNSPSQFSSFVKGIRYFVKALLLLGFKSDEFPSASEYVYDYISKLHNLPLDFIRELDITVLKIEWREVSNSHVINHFKIFDEVKPFLVKYL